MTKDITAEHVLNDLRYLTLLARSFPTVADASTEIINLEAILNLPKGTEHFLSDIHGEHQAFNHVLKNASGAIKRKVNEIFSNTLRDFEKKELCTLIYYPEQKLELIRQREKDLDDWYLITLNQLVRVCRNVSSKYTRSKVRKALPKEFSYIIQELLHESSDEPNKSAYVDQIIKTIISTGRANDFIIAMCNLIQRLTIDLLHIIGDIYDRGPQPDVIMETLSIIAYKQPITKVEIEKIRGVSCDHAVNKLVEYNLVKELGRLDAPGRPLLFGTTEEFLRSFGALGIKADRLSGDDGGGIKDYRRGKGICGDPLPSGGQFADRPRGGGRLHGLRKCDRF